MKKAIITISIPALIVSDSYLFSFVTELIRQKSDMAVFIGILSLFALPLSNYFAVNYIIKQLKPKTQAKNEKTNLNS